MHLNTSANYVVEDSIEQAINTLNMIEQTVKIASCDIETGGLNWQRDPILAIGWSWQKNQAYILPPHIFQDPIVQSKMKTLFENRNIEFVWHNGKFDIEFIRYQLNINARVDLDTMLMHYILDEKSREESGISHALKPLIKLYLNAPILDLNLSLDRGMKMSSLDAETLGLYHSIDLDYTLQLYYYLSKQFLLQPKASNLFSNQLSAYRSLLIPAANALAEIEMTGVAVDINSFKTMQTQLELFLQEQQQIVQQHIIDITNWKPDNIQLDSNSQIASIVYDHLKYINSNTNVDTRTLKRLAKNKPHPFMTAFLTYRQLNQFFETGIIPILNKIGSDNRVHPDFLIHATQIGNLITRNPNLQAISHLGSLPNIFIASTDYVLLNTQFPLIEVTVAAVLSHDDTLINDLKGNLFQSIVNQVFADILTQIDTISNNSAALFEYMQNSILFQNIITGNEDDLVRTMIEHLIKMSKLILIGILHGYDAHNLVQNNHQLFFSVTQVQQYIQTIRQYYQKLSQWIESIQTIAITQEWLDNPFGRRRHLSQNVMSEKRVRTEAIKFIVLSTCADIILKTIIQLQSQKSDVFRILFLIEQNEILFEVKGDQIQDFIGMLRKTILRNFPSNSKNINLAIETRMASNWGEINKGLR